MSGTYASVKFSPQVGELLQLWCNRHGIPMTIIPEFLHCTVLYSRTEVEPIEIPLKKIYLSPKEFRIFDNGSERALVLLLDAPELSELHDRLIEQGGTHDYPEYNPHVTLSFQVSENLNINKFPVPPLIFVPSELCYEPLDPVWKHGVRTSNISEH